MTMAQLVFIGCPAFVGRIRDRTICDFYLTKTDYDEANAITVDLAKNVNLLVSSWAGAGDVRVDASVSDDPAGLTSIGPTFHVGSHKGVVYLVTDLYARLRAAGKLVSWPPPEDQAYQYQNVVRQGAGRGFDRFHGFAVEVIEVTGTVAQVAVYGVGSALPQRTVWLDLADPATCDPSANGLTTVAPISGSKGALFLSWSTITANSLRIPKLPPGDGAGALPSKDAP